jgi:hypothetical protein
VFPIAYRSSWRKNLYLVSASDHALTCGCNFNVGRCRGEDVDVVGNFFPGTFSVVIDAAHEVLDLFAKVFGALAEVKKLLLASFESVCSSNGILERNDVASDSDVIPVSDLELKAVVRSGGYVIGVELLDIFSVKKVANAINYGNAFHCLFHDLVVPSLGCSAVAKECRSDSDVGCSFLDCHFKVAAHSHAELGSANFAI